jgi:hypothetical protein
MMTWNTYNFILEVRCCIASRIVALWKEEECGEPQDWADVLAMDMVFSEFIADLAQEEVYSEITFDLPNAGYIVINGSALPLQNFSTQPLIAQACQVYQGHYQDLSPSNQYFIEFVPLDGQIKIKIHPDLLSYQIWKASVRLPNGTIHQEKTIPNGTAIWERNYGSCVPDFYRNAIAFLEGECCSSSEDCDCDCDKVAGIQLEYSINNNLPPTGPPVFRVVQDRKVIWKKDSNPDPQDRRWSIGFWLKIIYSKQNNLPAPFPQLGIKPNHKIGGVLYNAGIAIETSPIPPLSWGPSLVYSNGAIQVIPLPKFSDGYKWQHHMICYASGLISYYLNGVALGSPVQVPYSDLKFIPSAQTWANNLVVGCWDPTLVQLLDVNTIISSLVIYNEYLSRDDVWEVYLHKKSIVDSVPLSAAWPGPEDPFIPVLHDVSGFGRNLHPFAGAGGSNIIEVDACERPDRIYNQIMT